MPSWIGAMDVCVAPFLDSAGYRSPVKVFDYMACGKPVVASRIEGTTDIFEKSGAISLVKPGDPLALSRAICELLENPNRGEKMGKRGRRFIVDNFNRKHLAKIIENEAAKLIPKPGA